LLHCLRENSLVTFALLLPALLLFVTSMLAVFRAPTHFLWMTAVGVTEFGHYLGFICLGAAVVLSRNSVAGRVAAILSVIAALVSFTPAIRATHLARDLPQQLRKAFGDAVPARQTPLIYTELFSGVSLPQIKTERFIYSNVGGSDLSLDFYHAQTAGPAPLIIAIHGGSWRGGDNQDFIGMDRYLAGRGFAVADIVYRLAPKWKFPAPIDDVHAAIAFLRARADVLRIDPNQIVLLGRSAGGEIALTAAYSTKDAGIRGVISLYGPTDMYWDWDHPGNPEVIDTPGNIRDYLGGTPAEVSSAYNAASPIRLVTSSSPPTLLMHGDRDELVSPEDSARLSKRLTEAGIRNLNVTLPWATHGFDYIVRGPGGQIAAYAVEYFLKAITSPPPTSS
jgi:acetyl esterase/lipase